MVRVPHQLDDDARTKLRRLAGETPTDLDTGSGREKQVTPDLCALMREMADREDSKRAVSREIEWVAYDTALYHINGDCECGSRTHVHYKDCMRMRSRAHRGATPGGLAVLNGLEENTVIKHLSGRCQHDDGFDPLPTGNGPTAYTEAPSD